MRDAILLALASAAILGCGRDVDEPEPGRSTISSRTFAAVVSDLSVARVETHPDTAAYERRREAILERHDVTEGDLWTFVRVRGRDEDTMTEVYRAVGARLDTLFGERPPDRFPAPPDTIDGTPDAIADTLGAE